MKKRNELTAYRVVKEKFGDHQSFLAYPTDDADSVMDGYEAEIKKLHKELDDYKSWANENERIYLVRIQELNARIDELESLPRRNDDNQTQHV